MHTGSTTANSYRFTTTLPLILGLFHGTKAKPFTSIPSNLVVEILCIKHWPVTTVKGHNQDRLCQNNPLLISDHICSCFCRSGDAHDVMASKSAFPAPLLECRFESWFRLEALNFSMWLFLKLFIIIITTFKGAFQDCLQSPHSAMNRLQHVHSSSRAQSCANYVQHVECLSQATCRVTCHVV